MNKILNHYRPVRFITLIAAALFAIALLAKAAAVEPEVAFGFGVVAGLLGLTWLDYRNTKPRRQTARWHY